MLTEGGDFDKLGRGHVWRGEIADCLHQNHIFVVRAEADLLHSELLAAITSGPYGRAYFLSCSKQSTNLASINSTQLKRMPLPVPPRGEQDVIVNYLRVFDKAMERTECLVRAKQSRLSGLTQQLLTGRRRLLAFGDQRTKEDGVLGIVPTDWEVMPLTKIVKKVTRRNTLGETHVLTASGRHGLVDQREFFNRSVAGPNLASYYLLKRGEFAYNRSRMNGYEYGAIKRLDRYDQGALSTLYLCFAIKDNGVDSDFLRWYCEGGHMGQQLRRITPIGGRAHGLLNITDDDFYSIRVVLPKLAEQRAIAEVLETAQREIELLERLREQIQIQKRGLMQKLLTGRIRVPTTQPEAADWSPA